MTSNHFFAASLAASTAFAAASLASSALLAVASLAVSTEIGAGPGGDFAGSAGVADGGGGGSAGDVDGATGGAAAGGAVDVDGVDGVTLGEIGLSLPHPTTTTTNTATTKSFFTVCFGKRSKPEHGSGQARLAGRPDFIEPGDERTCGLRHADGERRTRLRNVIAMQEVLAVDNHEWIHRTARPAARFVDRHRVTEAPQKIREPRTRLLDPCRFVHDEV